MESSGSHPIPIAPPAEVEIRVAVFTHLSPSHAAKLVRESILAHDKGAKRFGSISAEPVGDPS